MAVCWCICPSTILPATDPVYEALPEVIDGVAYGAIHTTGTVTIDLRAADGSNAPGPITGPTTGENCAFGCDSTGKLINWIEALVHDQGKY